MFNIKKITTIKERLELKSSLVQYINERAIKYTRLDRHDKAILVLLQENKDLEEDIEFYKDMLNQFKKQFERLEEELEAEKSTSSNLSRRILKAIKYLKLKVDIPKNHLEEAIKDREEDLLKILKGEENESN